MRAVARAFEPGLSPRERAIARTVIYASLFDYPLRLGELHESLIESSASEDAILAAYRASPALRRTIAFDGRFFFPASRPDLPDIRRRRERLSREFLDRHDRILRLVCRLPFVRMVAVSGSLAHLNLDGKGDLDLFVITRGRRAWLVTVAIVLLSKLLRRRATVCANFVLSDERLAVSERDLFTANQILHLKPIAGVAVFRAFVAANPFVIDFYPNFSPERDVRFPFAAGTRPWWMRVVETVLAIPSRAADVFCRAAYGAYLRRRAASWKSPSHVVLDPDCVKLHTHSHREPALERFDKAVADILEC